MNVIADIFRTTLYAWPTKEVNVNQSLNFFSNLLADQQNRPVTEPNQLPLLCFW